MKVAGTGPDGPAPASSFKEVVHGFRQDRLRGPAAAFSSDAPTPGGGTAAALTAARWARRSPRWWPRSPSRRRSMPPSHDAVRPIAGAGGARADGVAAISRARTRRPTTRSSPPGALPKDSRTSRRSRAPENRRGQPPRDRGPDADGPGGRPTSRRLARARRRRATPTPPRTRAPRPCSSTPAVEAALLNVGINLVGHRGRDLRRRDAARDARSSRKKPQRSRERFSPRFARLLTVALAAQPTDNTSVLPCRARPLD